MYYIYLKYRIFLALSTHEPHFIVVREKLTPHYILKKMEKQGRAKKTNQVVSGVDEPDYHLVYVNLLRQYIINDIYNELPPVIGLSLNIERVLDDFIFLSFFIGNDFLPHPPSLAIGNDAFDKIFDAYRYLLCQNPGYIVNNGDIEDMNRLENIFQLLGSNEISNLEGDIYGKRKSKFKDGNIRYHYYKRKFDIDVNTTEGILFIQELVKFYLTGLLWCLKYYTQGCSDWNYFFPYHYSPLISDMIGLAEIKKSIQFSTGEAFLPFTQLLGCLPPASNSLLPELYRSLLTEDVSSPLSVYYPNLKSIKIDMDGKVNSWEGISLLPFIDSNVLLQCEANHCDSSLLTFAERNRNKHGVVYEYIFDVNNHEKITAPNLISSISSDITDCQTSKSISQMTVIGPGTPFVSDLYPGTILGIEGFPLLENVLSKNYIGKDGNNNHNGRNSGGGRSINGYGLYQTGRDIHHQGNHYQVNPQCYQAPTNIWDVFYNTSATNIPQQRGSSGNQYGGRGKNQSGRGRRNGSNNNSVVCRYFNSPSGCKFGNSCVNIH
jgi:5'-3' exonuclease